MDVAWLIIDSLSYSVTPFAPDGPDTMPHLETLAKQHGIVFTDAYVPGPSSPSSHSAFFTGKLPSETGMHEARPYFDSDLQTIAGALPNHRSFLISANPFIFSGLDRDFDETDDLRRGKYKIFEKGADPELFAKQYDFDSTLKQYISFVARSGTPLRSFINGVSFKLWNRRETASIPKRSAGDAESYQYANTINDGIRRFRGRIPGESFVVANYMDVHPPLDASDEAIERFVDDADRDDLPIGVRGQDIHERVLADDEYQADDMYDLYKAAVYDVDRKVAPLVEELLAEDTFVVLTADHGIWFRRRREFEDERIHVPLVLFAPDEQSRQVDYTVNLLALPHTTTKAVIGDDQGFHGYSLFDVAEEKLSLTEFIHDENIDGTPVNPTGEDAGQTRFDIAAIRGNVRVEYVDGVFDVLRGDKDDTADLKESIEARLQKYPDVDHGGIEYDETVHQRLKDFGYL